MRQVVGSILCVVASLFTFACGQPGTYNPGANPWAPQPTPDGPTGPATNSAPTCDKKLCNDYCYIAGCMWDNGMPGDERCVALCTSQCGDGFFDDVDASMISCAQAVGISLACDGVKTCCEQNTTNQLCP